MYWSLENVPWTNLHDLNLDWIVNTMKQTVEQWISYRAEMDENFADFTEQINSDFTDFTEQINSDFTDFTTGINAWKTLIESEFSDLQTYVQDYFDNLDLNESTRYVINQMIASGEFVEVLNPSIVSATEAWLAAHVTPTSPAVDNTLTISGAAADAKKTGDEIAILKNAATYNIADLSPFFTPGLIPLYSPAVGDIVDTETRNSISTSRSLVVPCLEGDSFTVTATGGVQARPWAFLDTDKRLLSKADGNLSVENLTVTAEQDGYFISSCVNDANPPFAVSSKQFFNLTDMQIEIDNIANGVYYNKNLTSLFVAGIIPLNDVNVGDLVDTKTLVSFSSGSTLVVPCLKSDTFTVTGTGGPEARPWAFLNSSKRLVSKADSNINVENLTLKAEQDGYFISSCVNNSTPPFNVTARQLYNFNIMNDTIDNIENVLMNYNQDLSGLFEKGLVPLYDPAIGDVVNIYARSAVEQNKCLVIKCQKGDKFIVSATGGVQGRPWAFVDENKKLISKADGNTSVENYEVEATANGYFISSCTNSSAIPFSVYADRFYDVKNVVSDVENLMGGYSQPVYKLLTDPYLLNFRWGQLSLTGNYTHNVTTLTLRDAIPVKAGDIITVASGCQLQVIHSIDGGKAFTDGNLQYIVANNGNITIGIRYSDQRNLDNNKILDNLHINLHTVVDRLRGDNKDKVFFGRVPGAGWYLGKHTDTSGFNQDTNYDTIIAAWETLIDSPYITKEDLGLSEDNQHVYCYHIKPPEFATTLNGKRHPRVVVITGQHGHEKSGSYGLLYLIRDMLDNAMSDPILHYLRDNIEFAIIPVANPWGWNNNSRYNINGVNLNRNYGSYNWAELTDESYVTPFEYNYKGTAPFSESETRMIRDVVTRYSDAPIIIDWHTLGGSPGVTTYPEMGWFSHPYYIRNEYDDRLANACMTMLESTKSYFDNIYDVNGGVGQAYCEYANEPNRPSLNTWVFESTNSLSTTLETGNGSKDTFLGNKLRFYSPDTIKMSAEMFANYLITILRELM